MEIYYPFGYDQLVMIYPGPVTENVTVLFAFGKILPLVSVIETFKNAKSSPSASIEARSVSNSTFVALAVVRIVLVAHCH